MKRMMAMTLAALLAAASLTACGFEKEPDGSTLEIPLDNSYRSTELTELKDWSLLNRIGNCVYFSTHDSQNRTSKILEYNAETGETREITPACAEERQAAANNISCSIIMELEDGKKGLLCEEYKSNMFNAPDIFRRCIEVYDADWNLMETQELPEDFAEDMNVQFHGTARDADGNWFVYVYDQMTGESRIDTYNSEYEQYGTIDLPPNGSMSGQEFIVGTDGEVYMVWMNWDAPAGNYAKMYRLSAEDRTMEDVDISLGTDSDLQGLLTGTDGYDFYQIDANYMWGIKDGEKEKVISFTNSDFKKDSVYDCVPLPNNKFLLCCYHDTEQEYWLAEARSQEEIDSTQFITLATVGMYDQLEDAVLDYNRSSTGWRILVVDYAPDESYEGQKQGLEALYRDMVDGVVADLICTDGLNFESLAGKGLFADWYDLMDEDEEFDREDYLQNYFEAYEYDGELQRLGVDFAVHTQVAKTEFAGEQTGYTAAEFMELYESLPEGMYLYDSMEYWNRLTAASYLLPASQNTYVNREKAECDFDSPEFIRFLEILSSCPADYSWEQYKKEYGYTTDDEAYHALSCSLRENRALLHPCTIDQPIDYHSIQKAYFLDEDISFVGYPMYENEGNGGRFSTLFTLSVNAQSKHSEAIWGFVKHLLSEEYQKKIDTYMPIHIGALEEKLDTATNMNGAKTWFGSGEVNVGAATQEEMDELYDYIKGIEAVYDDDETVTNILYEEAEMYLSDDAAAQETAEKIQGRVSIYLSEQS